MTGPIARVVCDHCGRIFARRRDGAPYAHRCGDGPPPSHAARRHCPGCGAFATWARPCAKCGASAAPESATRKETAWHTHP